MPHRDQYKTSSSTSSCNPCAGGNKGGASNRSRCEQGSNTAESAVTNQYALARDKQFTGAFPPHYTPPGFSASLSFNNYVLQKPGLAHSQNHGVEEEHITVGRLEGIDVGDWV